MQRATSLNGLIVGPAFLFSLVLLTSDVSPARADEYESGEIVVMLVPGASIEEVNARWGTTTLDAYPEANLYLVYSDSQDAEDVAEDMEDDPAVEEADANYFEETPEGVRQMVLAAIGGSWSDFEDQELTERIGLDQAHAYSQGAGVTVAVLDTGVDPGHIAFAGRLSPDGIDFVDNDAQPWEEGNGLDDDQDGMIDNGYGHGTMVAGIVGLVAPQATLLPIRVLDDEGSGNAYVVAKGIRYALLHGADVLNMSFGGPNPISIIRHQLDVVELDGAVVVAGAGNNNVDSPALYPAADSKAIMITALDSLDEKASFADFNSHVLVSAPGVGVRSAYPGNDWAIGDGCSFATPFVSGEVALILSLSPGLSPHELEDRLSMAVDPIYDLAGNEDYEGKLGTGRINLPLALADLVVSGLEAEGTLARVLAFPNPARSTIRFQIPGWGEGGILETRIFDATGRTVRRLSTNGPTTLEWDGFDEAGALAPAGSYFARVTSQSRSESCRFTVLR